MSLDPHEVHLPSPIIKFLQNLFTGKDGETFDIGRVLWAGSAIYAPILATIDVILNHTKFDIQNFGIGMGALLGGGGAAIAMKAKTEPSKPVTPPPAHPPVPPKA